MQLRRDKNCIELRDKNRLCKRALSAVPYAEEIIFAEYSEKNRQAVESWRQKSPDSHDWSPYFKFVVQNLEGKERHEVLIREDELRKKITHILPCDIGWKTR